ncbi:MAG: hypothetical protein AB7F32_05015 [Victivallaceae bacterium]
MTFIEAVLAGVISEEEVSEASCAMSDMERLIRFDNWYAENEPCFRDHNMAVCMLEESKIAANKLFDELKKKKG